MVSRIETKKGDALIEILYDSQWFISGILLFSVVVFSKFGLLGFHSLALWFICFACVVNLFRNAINASEAGL
jgi:hypothetical protein